MTVRELIAFLSSQEPGRQVNIFLREGRGSHGPGNGVWISDFGYPEVDGFPFVEGTTPLPENPNEPVVLIGEVP